MSEYNAAVLLASIDNWASDRVLWLEQLARAGDLAKKYGYTSSPQLSTPQATPYWIVEECDRLRLDRLKTSFKENFIQTRNWWESGCHKMSAYDHFDRKGLTNTDRISEQTLGLPFWIDMDEQVWRRIEIAFQAADPR
jgi:dTDP-4-amino-4,6-dideoxygalactose transaminase